MLWLLFLVVLLVVFGYVGIVYNPLFWLIVLGFILIGGYGGRAGWYGRRYW